MKRTTAIALLAIANCAISGTSFAQSNEVRATVPFDFTVENELLPSGTYTIGPRINGPECDRDQKLRQTHRGPQPCASGRQ